MEHIPPNQQRLMFEGSELWDGKCLKGLPFIELQLVVVDEITAYIDWTRKYSDVYWRKYSDAY